MFPKLCSKHYRNSKSRAKLACLNFLPPSLGQREGQSENTLCQVSRMTWRGQVPAAARMEGSLSLAGVRDKLCSEPPAAGRQMELGASTIVTTCFRANVLGEDSREGSIQNTLLLLITTQPQTKQSDGFQFVPLLFLFCLQLCALHKEHSCCGTVQGQSVSVLFE